MNKSISGQSSPFQISNSKHYLLLFLMWPLLAFIASLTNYDKRESRNVVYLFLVYVGLTYVIGGGYYVDAAGYANDLKVNAALPFSDFFKIVGGLYTTDTSVDILEPLISFIVSRFTDDYRILFAVFAAIFGFIYLKSINLLYDRYFKNPVWNTAIHLGFFSVILTITSINGFRMWTAAWIFFYGTYHVVLYRNAKYLILAFSSIIVHWSFISASGILIIYFFIGNRNLFYIPLAIASFIVPQIISPFFQSITMGLGGALQSRAESYSSEAYILTREEDFEQTVWFLRLSYDLITYYLLFALLIIQYRFGHLMNEKPEKNLFSFSLLFLAFVNFGKVIPSFGGRFQVLFFMFATLYVFMYFIKTSGNKINFLTLVGLFPMLLYTAIVFRQGSENINAWILSPGFGLPLFVPGLSISEFLFH